MVRITREFVDRESARFDEDSRYGRYGKYYQDEQQLKRWLADQSGRKFLDRGRFLDLAMWKSARPRRLYERNRDDFVRKVTALAFQADDDRLRLQILMALDGVRVPLASTILHFAFPDMYPILDVRVLRTLRNAGLWHGHDAPGFTLADWLKYTRLMRGLSKKLRVDLRTLDKALWAFDKHEGKVHRRASS